jgi:dephospho-CoA kinase
LRELGFAVLDADEVVRQVLSPGSEGEREVLHAFASEPGVREAVSGHLDRRALGRVVFADPVKLDQLERLIHPRVQSEVARQRSALQALGHDVPLLFEKKMEPLFDQILVVSASESVRLKRLIARTGLSPAEIQERWSRQLSPAFKEARATAVVVNNGNLDDMKMEVQACLKRLNIALPAATHT